MTNFYIIFLFVFIFFIQQSITQNPPVVPLTNALTAIYCHNFHEAGIMTIHCRANEKIRMLDAFDVVVKNKSRLPLQCLKQKHFSMVYGDNSNHDDCKVHTSFTSACSGRENCTLHMQPIRLNSANKNCHNELVDYTMAFFECISDVFIHDVCSSQTITSSWGTLKTPNFPNPYTPNDDCWCKLSTQLQYRLLLSVIIFQLIPYDQQCIGAGLYLQSSDEQRSTQCTYLQQGHNYLSDTNSLYLNFYSRTPTVRGGFWVIYEASHPNAEVHLHCGPREKIGVPSGTPLLPTSIEPPPISSSYDYGWSRLAFNNPPNPTTPITDPMMYMHLLFTTPLPYRNTNSKVNPILTTTPVGAFTYPYGHLTTFELAYGPQGWFLRSPFISSNKTTATKFLPTTTSQLPIVKWNSTWRYIRRSWTRISTTMTTRSPTIKTITATTSQTTTSKSTTRMTRLSTSTIKTTEQNTILLSSTTIPMSTVRNTTIQPRLLFTHNPWIYYSSNSVVSSTTTTKPKTTSTMQLPVSSFMLKPNLPSPTPWYPPAGPFDWWQWQWYTTKFKKVSLKSLTTTETSTSSMQTTTTTTTTTTITTTITTTTTTATTTRKSTINPSTTINRKTITRRHEVTADWFKWPYTESTSPLVQRRPDYYEEEYMEWPDYFLTSKIQNARTPNSLVSFSPEQPRQQYQQISLFPIKSKWQYDNRLVTTNTPSSKGQYTQQNTGRIEERDTPRIQQNGVTNTYAHNIIRDVIQQSKKKTSEENEWLSKTDITIVAVSMLFVILLFIINLILYAVRRHHHRLQHRHLLSASTPSLLNGSRRTGINGSLQRTQLGDSTSSIVNTTNNNNNSSDILPAVGEIVIWDEKDQGGYMIGNHGEWAKIQGRQWFRSSLLKSCSKSSFSKSFRSRFQFSRQSNKKINDRHQPTSIPNPKQQQQQQQIFKYPLLLDTATLAPVPEADDYQSSSLSSSDVMMRSSAATHTSSNKISEQTTKTIQALIHAEQDHSDEYYKRIDFGTDESNYSITNGHVQGEYSILDQQTDRSLGNEVDAGRSIIISVPTMFRREEDTTTITDGADSSYNQTSSSKHLMKNTNITTRPNYLQPNNTSQMATKQSARLCKSSTNNSIIVGHCQTDFQPLDPKLLVKSTDKSLLAEHQQFYNCSQSFQLSAYDSGFFDDQISESLTIPTTKTSMITNELKNNLGKNVKKERKNIDDMLININESNEESVLSLNDLSTKDIQKLNRQKQRHVTKHVSFQS
ncbi:unnamed protein product [Rotaria sordida]|uniref:CUB domain-containing protein n=2 Tax=Rotaria sordida TaxID=392033 RepID=A0A815BKD4_9BILA|nr:unnamed protein product [Rotaria sordida]